MMIILLKTRRIIVVFLIFAALFVVLVTVVLYANDDFNRGVVHDQALRSNNGSLDFFSGRWVFNESYRPIYDEKRCSFMEVTFACETYGRKDLKYQQWRWKPNSSDLPRFNGRALLENLRGKKLLFVGDSVNRNQWISLLCMIESSLPTSSNKTIESNGSLYSFHDMEYNATIGFYWSPFLLESNCDIMRKHRPEGCVIRFGSIEKHARHWNDADFLIFNSHTWWLSPSLTFMWGSFGRPDAMYKTLKMKRRRYEMALNTWANWLEININRTRTKLFFMSLSPFLFNKDPMRHCYNKSEPLFIPSHLSNQTMMLAADEAIKQLNKRFIHVEFLRITEMSEYRIDAHPSIYRYFYHPLPESRDPLMYSDCLHWCLPGVPDVWNQILYAYIMKS